MNQTERNRSVPVGVEGTYSIYLFVPRLDYIHWNSGIEFPWRKPWDCGGGRWTNCRLASSRNSTYSYTANNPDSRATFVYSHDEYVRPIRGERMERGNSVGDYRGRLGCWEAVCRRNRCPAAARAICTPGRKINKITEIRLRKRNARTTLDWNVKFFFFLLNFLFRLQLPIAYDTHRRTKQKLDAIPCYHDTNTERAAGDYKTMNQNKCVRCRRPHPLRATTVFGYSGWGWRRRWPRYQPLPNVVVAERSGGPPPPPSSWNGCTEPGIRVAGYRRSAVSSEFKNKSAVANDIFVAYGFISHILCKQFFFFHPPTVVASSFPPGPKRARRNFHYIFSGVRQNDSGGGPTTSRLSRALRTRFIVWRTNRTINLIRGIII